MFKKYPFIKQKETKDCGVACLLMIFKYYNGYVNMMKLEELTKTTTNGTTAYHLIETLKYYGFEAKGIKCSINDIKEQKLPAIAHVTINKTYNHYIVIYKIKKDYLIVADPSDSIKKIKTSDFEKIYNNVLITMYPTKTLPKYFESQSKTDFCMNIIKNYKSLIYKLIILSIIVTFFSILSTYYLKYMIENINSIKTINFVFILFLHFYLLNIFSNHLRNKLLIYISKYIDYDITTITFKQIINLPYRYYASRTIGDIISRISDLEVFRQTISRLILILFVDLCLFLISFITLYILSEKLAFISLIILLLYFLLFILFRNKIKKNINDCQIKKAENTSYMIETISNYESINGLNIKDKIINKFEQNYLNYLEKIFKTEKTFNNQTLLKNIISEIGFIITIYIGILEVHSGNLSIGSLMTFNSLIVYLMNPVKEIIDLDSDISASFNSIDRILELYHSEKESGFIKNNIKGNIVFNNLSFSYDDFKNILRNINLEIKNNEKVLFLGKSGSGKSTLLKIIKQYYKISRNSLTINDIDINDYTKQSIDENICYISQNEYLFTDTLYNNIDLYRNIDSKKIYEISKMCEIDFIDEKLGYNMLIEENGFNLSGGQKQRLILARSLLKKFNILLIDEATNQMDHNLERKILKKIFQKFNDKIIIIVSHRMENMDLFDKIVKFENGKIKEVITKND